MPSYWLSPKADISVALPGRPCELSEGLYGLIGGGCTALFDAFPPVFTQIQKLAGVDVDSLLPLYISDRFTEREEMPSEISRVAKPLEIVRERFHALREALVLRPGWERELILPERGYAPARAYFEHFAAAPPLSEELAEQLEWGIIGPEDLDEDPSFRGDVGELLRFLDHARQHGGTLFWFLGR